MSDSMKERRPSEFVLDGRSFDEVLGPGEGRYLASGFARVARGFRDGVVQTSLGRVAATATCFATYPTDWSVKKQVHSYRT